MHKPGNDFDGDGDMCQTFLWLRLFAMEASIPFVASPFGQGKRTRILHVRPRKKGMTRMPSYPSPKLGYAKRMFVVKEASYESMTRQSHILCV
jgi:hypothetical protein